jgi:hypothetical protein
MGNGAYALMMHSTGHTDMHCGESWCPTHSTQVSALITYMGDSSVIDSVGHSGTHAPQEMHSSVIFIAMVVSPNMISGV